jgi:hypothetical protein
MSRVLIFPLSPETNVLIQNAYAQTAAAVRPHRRPHGHAADDPDVRRAVVPDDPAADEAAKEHKAMLEALPRVTKSSPRAASPAASSRSARATCTVEIAAGTEVVVQKPSSPWFCPRAR